MEGAYNDVLVGAIALLVSLLAMGAAMGPWMKPYQLRTISAIAQRYGKPTARAVWLAIAVASFSAGVAILNGVRPSYAQPAVESVQ